MHEAYFSCINTIKSKKVGIDWCTTCSSRYPFCMRSSISFRDLKILKSESQLKGQCSTWMDILGFLHIDIFHLSFNVSIISKFQCFQCFQNFQFFQCSDVSTFSMFSHPRELRTLANYLQQAVPRDLGALLDNPNHNTEINQLGN